MKNLCIQFLIVSGMISSPSWAATESLRPNAVTITFSQGNLSYGMFEQPDGTSFAYHFFDYYGYGVDNDGLIRIGNRILVKSDDPKEEILLGVLSDKDLKRINNGEWDLKVRLQEVNPNLYVSYKHTVGPCHVDLGSSIVAGEWVWRRTHTSHIKLRDADQKLKLSTEDFLPTTFSAGCNKR